MINLATVAVLVGIMSAVILGCGLSCWHFILLLLPCVGVFCDIVSYFCLNRKNWKAYSDAFDGKD